MGSGTRLSIYKCFLLVLLVIFVTNHNASGQLQSKVTCHRLLWKQRPSTCERVSLPGNLCVKCALNPITNNGLFSNCTSTVDIGRDTCLKRLKKYVKLNPCDKPRKDALDKYLGKLGPEFVEEGRQVLDFFVYSICEGTCDCIPQVDADPAMPEMAVERGNCARDLCMIHPEIRAIASKKKNKDPWPEGSATWPKVCPQLEQWVTSAAASHWNTNANVSDSSGLGSFIETLLFASDNLNPRAFQDRYNLEARQRRIQGDAETISPAPLAAVTQPTSSPVSSAPNIPDTRRELVAVYRVNAGSVEPYKDTDDRKWNADTNYNKGKLRKDTTNQPIEGATDPTIYRSEHYDAQSKEPNLQYQFPVGFRKSDIYQVRLHFAELAFAKSGDRVFDVHINGQEVLTQFDIIDEAGSNFTAVVKEFDVRAADIEGFILVEFINRVQLPTISALEVLRYDDGLPIPGPLALEYKALYRINAGGDNYKDINGTMWTKDAHFNTGKPYVRDKDALVLNRPDATIYNTERYDKPNGPELEYKLLIDASLDCPSYKIRLHFAEIYVEQVGQRVFDVNINGMEFLRNYDIIDKADGINRAVVEEYELLPSEFNEVRIQLKHVVENPKISAIEVLGRMKDLPPPIPAWLTVSTTNHPIPNHESCFVMAGNDKAYLIGGRTHANVCEYDPSNQTWDCSRDKPPILLHHMQCVAVGNDIWIPSSWTGCYPHEDNVPFIYVYDTENNNWTTRPGLPPSRLRGSSAAAYYNGDIYVSHGNIGGHGNHATSLTDFDKYNIAQGTWTPLPNAAIPRDHTGGGIVTSWNGTTTMFCVAGGRNGGVNGVNHVALPTECYDLNTNTWSIHDDIPQGRSGSAYGTTCDGRLVVAGGEGFNMAWKNVEVFDGQGWTQYPNLQTGRHGTGLAVSCNDQCNQQIHIATGSPRQGGGEVNTTETLFLDGINIPCSAGA